MSANYETQLCAIAEDLKELVVMTAENRSSIRNLQSCYKGLFIDTGISEQTLLGVAAGLAMRKKIPVVHAIGAFVTMRSYEFIRTDIALHNLPVKIAASFTGLLSEANGPTHQAVEDIALMRTMPNMVIFCPSDEEDLLLGLETVLRSPSPAYIRLNHLPPTINHSSRHEIGKAEVVRQNAEQCHFSIFVYGTLFKEALKACYILEDLGYKIRLINMRFLQPLDEDLIVQSAETSEMLVTIEDHYKYGGLYTAICELLIEKGLSKKVYPICLQEKFFAPARLDEVIAFEGLRGEHIAHNLISQGGFNAK